MKKGEFEFKQIVSALIIIIVLILIIMFLTNIDKLKDVLLRLSSFG